MLVGLAVVMVMGQVAREAEVVAVALVVALAVALGAAPGAGPGAGAAAASDPVEEERCRQ